MRNGMVTGADGRKGGENQDWILSRVAPSLARSTTEVNSAVGERGAAHGGLEKDLSRLDSFE